MVTRYDQEAPDMTSEVEGGQAILRKIHVFFSFFQQLM